MIKNIIKKLLDIICFVGGSSLTFYALVSFEAHSTYAGRNNNPIRIYYQYDFLSILYGTVGIGLVALGFVLRSWYKQKWFYFTHTLNYLKNQNNKENLIGREIINNQELLVSNMLEIQALIRILERKGITNYDEILEEVKKLQVEMEEKIKKMGREN